MAVFDQLPREVREAIASSPVNHERSFDVILAMHRRGVPPAALALAIERASEKKVAEHRARIDDAGG